MKPAKGKPSNLAMQRTTVLSQPELLTYLLVRHAPLSLPAAARSLQTEGAGQPC